MQHDTPLLLAPLAPIIHQILRAESNTKSSESVVGRSTEDPAIRGKRLREIERKRRQDAKRKAKTVGAAGAHNKVRGQPASQGSKCLTMMNIVTGEGLRRLLIERKHFSRHSIGLLGWRNTRTQPNKRNYVWIMHYAFAHLSYITTVLYNNL